MKKWEIMKAFEEGAEIEFHTIKEDSGWEDAKHPAWDWSMFDYRVKQQKWQPSDRGAFYITSDNQIDTCPSEEHVNFGVAFYSSDDAKKAAKVFRKFHRLYQLAFQLNEGWEPDWDDDNQNKYFIEYDHLYKEWNIDYVANYQTSNGIYFKSKEIAKHAIRMIEAGALE